MNQTSTFMGNITSITLPDATQPDLGGETSRAPGDPSGKGDSLVQKYELEDSVHSVEWTACEAWVFAGLSYNGSLILQQVPANEKYKILL